MTQGSLRSPVSVYSTVPKCWKQTELWEKPVQMDSIIRGNKIVGKVSTNRFTKSQSSLRRFSESKTVEQKQNREYQNVDLGLVVGQFSQKSQKKSKFKSWGQKLWEKLVQKKNSFFSCFFLFLCTNLKF